MEKFNYNRFTHINKWFATNMKTKTLRWFSICTIFMLILFLSTATYSIGDETFPTFTNMRLGLIFCIALTIIFTMIPSGIASDLKDGERRLNYLMLPGSNIEKFASRYLCIVIGGTLLFIAAFLVSDLIQGCVVATSRYINVAHNGAATRYDNIFITPTLVENKYYVEYMIGGGKDSLCGTLEIYSFLLFLHSLYLLGGMWIRKHQLIIITACGIMAQFIIIRLLISILNSYNFTIGYATQQIIGYSGSAIMIAISLLNTFLSYRCFCRMQMGRHGILN